MRRGLVLGKFLPYHEGHALLIRCHPDRREATRQPYLLLSGAFVERHTAARAEIDRVLTGFHDS